MRQPSSTTSFRSAAAGVSNYQTLSQAQQHGLGHAPVLEAARDRHLRSAASIFSDNEDAASRRSSLSSEHFQPRPSLGGPTLGGTSTPGRAGASGMSALGGSTDPTIIHAITQTMIGEFLYKYTRKPIGKGHGERRHKRFFWVHPYTKTLYWSSADPGSSNVSESSAKSGKNFF